MNTPLVSIITPNFNRARLLPQTIDSVICQTYKNWEMIIVDDGSTDESISTIEKYCQIDNRIKLIVRNTEPKGAANCRNIGVENSIGEYLIFLDSDDLLATFCLEQRIYEMQKNQQLDFGVFNLKLFNSQIDDLNVLFNKYFESNENYLHSFLNDNPPWAINCTFWKKAFFIKIGGFDQNFWIMDDPEIHVRALLNDANFKIFHESKPDCFYRINYSTSFDYNIFFKDSIEGRIKFVKKIYPLIFEKQENRNLLNILKIGIIKIIKNWFFAHFKNNSQIISDFLKWIKQKKLISSKNYLLSKLILYLWKNDNSIIRFFKLKGLLSKLI